MLVHLSLNARYASRVKLITNDAQKNSDSKEIARLKAVSSHLSIWSILNAYSLSCLLHTYLDFTVQQINLKQASHH